MNKRLRLHALRRAATCRNLLAGLRIAACALVALPASARTVYDAGKALRQNFQNNATPVNPYTDENGGKWTYSSAGGVAPFSNLGNFASSYAKIDNDQLQGWGGASSPHLKVNITDHALTDSSFVTKTGGVLDGEPIDVDEMVIHPGQTGNTYMVLRFIAPEDGWYSAFASFHDTAKETTATASSGASVAITLGANNVLARGIVSLEGAADSTKRFDFQMPVRYMTAGTEIRFAVGNNAGSSGTVHASDATGVKVFVTRRTRARSTTPASRWRKTSPRATRTPSATSPTGRGITFSLPRPTPQPPPATFPTPPRRASPPKPRAPTPETSADSRTTPPARPPTFS
jgi:hypothetical protein